MKTLKIVKKSQADKILTESLFRPINGKTLNRGLYDSGKYAVKDFIGREVNNAPDSVYAIYPVTRSDSHGKYVALYCIYA
jgi:hypothetical protein